MFNESCIYLHLQLNDKKIYCGIRTSCLGLFILDNEIREYYLPDYSKDLLK